MDICRVQARTTCNSLPSLLSLKVQEAAPLLLQARSAMMMALTQPADAARYATYVCLTTSYDAPASLLTSGFRCRDTQPAWPAASSWKLSLRMKRTKQRIAKLQRKQWANGVTAFSSKVQMQSPLRASLPAVLILLALDVLMRLRMLVCSLCYTRTTAVPTDREMQQCCAGTNIHKMKPDWPGYYKLHSIKHHLFHFPRQTHACCWLLEAQP